MSLMQKLKTFANRCGAPAKFVAKTIIGCAVPGSGPVMELIEQLMDCATEPELEALASKEDLQRIEKMFDVLLDDMSEVVEHLRHLEQVPDLARKTLHTALATEQHCLAAAESLEQQGLQLTAVQAELNQLTVGQKELLDLQRRQNGTLLDYIKEQKQHNVAPSQMNERLKKIEEAIFAMRQGKAADAEKILTPLSAAQPNSAVLTIAVAASQAAGHSFVRAAKTLERAATLRPRDVKLVEMSRVATGLGGDPAPPSPQLTKKYPKPGNMLGGWVLDQLLGFGGWGRSFALTRTV